MPEAPPEQPPVEEPAMLPPEQPPVEEPAVPPVEEPQPEVPAPTEPAPAEPAPAEPAPAEPAPEVPAPTLDDDPFSKSDNGYRMWTDSSGRHQVVARYVTTFRDGVVRLQKPNGRYVRVAFDRLSLMDQGFVRTRTASLAMN
jgi:hypothetical protein